MYKVNVGEGTLEKVEGTTLSALNLKERKHLQEWIESYPSCLGEDLLIIGKEYDGFDGTRKRLDLLALDKDGSLVVIENKRDDSGLGVIEQVLRYTAFCSTASKAEIIEVFQSYLDHYHNGKKAEDELSDFFDERPVEEIELNQGDQRMIIVAGSFPVEVASSALWLIDHGIQLKCVKVTPHEYNGDVLLDVDQVIPAREVEQIQFKKASNAMEARGGKTARRMREARLRKYWEQLLTRFNESFNNDGEACPNPYENVGVTSNVWLPAATGVAGVQYGMRLAGGKANVKLEIDMANKGRKDEVFNKLYSCKEEIEKILGEELDWKRAEGKTAYRIVSQGVDADVLEEASWEPAIEYHCDAMKRLIAAMQLKLDELLQTP